MSHLTCHNHIFFPLTSFFKHPVLPVLLPVGHAGSDRVRQDVLVCEGTAAHLGSGGLPGPLPPRLCPKVLLPNRAALQRHQVSDI